MEDLLARFFRLGLLEDLSRVGLDYFQVLKGMGLRNHECSTGVVGARVRYTCSNDYQKLHLQTFAYPISHIDQIF